MITTTLKGEKVTLRLAETKDLEACYYWEYEEEKQEAAKWNGPFYIRKEITQAEFIEKWENYEILPNVPGLLIIEVDGELIGIVDADWVDKNSNWLEAGIIIYKPEYWGGGYGTEAFKLFIDYLFTNTSLHRLGMSTWSGNIRMMKAAKKIGMVEEARILQARIVDGKYYDAIKMGILRGEWELLK
ncbi:MAG: GNAT family N-acetyltransferase [Defluviitaleaceae bacterium]|nr:GNAT family N-acetyltransferase [Defluviitaleaceae bacterium]